VPRRSQVADAPAGLGVDEDGGVDEAAAQGEVVIPSTRSGTSALAMSTMRDPRAQRAVACRRNVAEKSPPAQKIERAYEDSFNQHSAGGLIVFDSPDIESIE
jgi:hypothetical protein